MKRSELVEKLQDKLPKHSAKQVDDGVRSTLEIITNTLIARNRIEIRGFGTFSVRSLKPRLARNPKLGTVVQLKARAKVHFKPGKVLRERVNHG